MTAWKSIDCRNICHLESLEVVDENVGQPQMVDQLHVDWHHIARLIKFLEIWKYKRIANHGDASIFGMLCQY